MVSFDLLLGNKQTKKETARLRFPRVLFFYYYIKMYFKTLVHTPASHWALLFTGRIILSELLTVIF